MCVDETKLKIMIMGILAKRPSQKAGAEAILSLVKEHSMESRDRMLLNCQMNLLDTIYRNGGMDVIEAIRLLQLDDVKYADMAEAEGLQWFADRIREAGSLAAAASSGS